MLRITDRTLLLLSRNRRLLVIAFHWLANHTVKMDWWVGAVLPDISEKILRPALVGLLACLICVASIRLLVLVAVEPSKPHKLKLHYRPSSLSKRLLSTLPALRASYSVPGCWTHFVAGPARSVLILIATAATQLCTRWTGQVCFLREYLLMNDGGLVSLDWARIPGQQQQLLTLFPFSNQEEEEESRRSSSSSVSWIVILLPGFWVCNSKRNLQNVCLSLVDQGHRPVIWNRRGHDGTPMTDCRPTDVAGGGPCTSDLRQVICYLSNQHPNSPLALLGFSHAASLLISYLGEFGSSSLIHSAVAVSPLWQHLPAGLEWILSACKGIQRPDYGSADPLRDSDDIAVPLLVVHYDDDPLVPAKTLPLELFSLYPQLLLVTCPLGGHCGQLQPTPLADVIIGDFFHQVLAFTSWPLPAAEQQQQSKHCQQGKRKRVRSLTRTSTRKPRRHLKNGRPSCSSC